MKLEISKEEAEKILLDWAKAKFPGCFDSIETRFRYGGFEGFLVCDSEPAEPSQVTAQKTA